MTRMTNNIREAIWKKLAERSFKARVEAHVERQIAMAERIYQESFAAKQHKMMADLPEGWLPTDSDIKVQIAHQVVQVCFWGTGHLYSPPSEFTQTGFKRGEDRLHRFPHRLKGNVCAVFDADHPIRAAWDALQAEKVDLVKEIEAARHGALAIMGQASTVKRLIAIWPEAETFAKPFLADGERRALLPMIPIDNINRMLGLPPQETIQ